MDHPLLTIKAPCPDSFLKLIRRLPAIQQDLVVRHTFHVDTVAKKIGRIMNLDRYQWKVIHFAAVRHDVAKLLKKNQSLFFEYRGKFSDPQKQQADQHPYESAEIILRSWKAGQIPVSFEVVAPGVVAIIGHHWTRQESEARYEELLDSALFSDFADYCRTLGHFPLQAARILKVADCYVTAMEKRHYPKKVMNEQEAYVDLVSCGDLQYDSEAVAALWPIVSQSKRKLDFQASRQFD